MHRYEVQYVFFLAYQRRKDFLQLMMNAHEDGKCDKEVDSKAPDDHDLHSLIDEHHDTTFHISKKSQKTKLTTTELLAQVYGLKTTYEHRGRPILEVTFLIFENTNKWTIRSV